MSWEFLPATTTFANHAADWDRLNNALYDGYPYFDSRFVGPLLKYFAKGSERLCLYREQGVVRGALILQPYGQGRWVIFRPVQAPVTPILVADATLLQSLLKALPGFAWCIEFHAVDPRYAPSFAQVRGQIVISPHASTVDVVPGNGFDVYWQQRPKNLPSNISRYSNRPEREVGTFVLSSWREQEDIADSMARFGELESAGWKEVAGTAVSMGSLQGSFYAEVLTRFAATGQAEVYEMAIAGQLAASCLLIDNARMLVILKTTYDETLSQFAPGQLLLYQLLERELAEQPQRVVKFYANATRDQAEWSAFGCAVHSVQLFRSDYAIVAYTLFRTAKRQLLCSRRMRQPESKTPPVDVRCCTRLDEFPEGEWPFGEFALGGNLDVSIDWFALLQRQVYPGDADVRYYYLADNGQARAVLPLRRIRQGCLRTLESLSNYYTSLYSPLLGQDCDPLAVRHLLNAATRENRGAHMMRFAPMDPELPSYGVLLNELRAIGWIPLTFFCFDNWFLEVRGGWEDYLRQRSANLRSAVKRRTKKFVADGGTLELVSDAAGVEAGIAAFEEVYAASWKKPEPYPDFVPSLIRLLAANGMLRLGIACLQGRPIAAQLWMVGQGKASIYKVAYHKAFSAYSPGTVLTGFLMQQVIEGDQVKEVDFLIGDDKYKQTWMSDRRERRGIIAYNPRTVFGCALAIKEMAGRLAKMGGRGIGVALAAVKVRLRRTPKKK
ncbi:GNAT family N-acetyltransferase [Azonexus sp.]|jgi:CelD/BcsL family acetyltransferase involved in cellulose biosynthesis|uniref:GNAT family N-acetyltransferase n=1 Tax=Azonexus sp. TaxID=1872668 RepID=UPI00281D5AE2|nr:GNAT family N-acetyltransferase [Azonexus sp.]MDR1996240.1 GNAT family N-acetyltransferase [Azonexus sp.]